MRYCVNPQCQSPENPDGSELCSSCGSSLLLKGRYRAIKPLGQGGMGRTFLGIDEDRLNAKCAIKQFLPQFQGRGATLKATELFEREAVQLFELGEQHPQIPTLYAYFEQDRRLYLVEQAVEGQDLLKELYQEGAFGEQKIRELLLDLLPVLEFIHSRHVIHRDIKPENILRCQKDGQLVLVDFGIAKHGTQTALAQPGTTAGTQGYAPLEQIRGGQAYPASDLYCLGVTCIQLLSGTIPDELYHSLEGRWIWREQLAKRGGSISAELGNILDKMLVEMVADRYQSAAQVLQDLNADLQVGKLPQTVGEEGADLTPITQVPPTAISPLVTSPVTSVGDRIAAELEEVRVKLSEAGSYPGQQNPPPQNLGTQNKLQKNKSTTAKKKTIDDSIEADLEALRLEYGEEN